LVNDVEIMMDRIGHSTEKEYTQPVKDLNEYLNFNTDGFDEFTMEKKSIDLQSGDIKYPIYQYESSDELVPYTLFVSGQPGEIHYVFKDNIDLDFCVDHNIGVLSFGMKTGNNLTFRKNYVNEKGFFIEDYIPGKYVFTEVHDINLLSAFHNGTNVVKPQSAFQSQDFFTTRFLSLLIFVSQKGPNLYEVDIRDCDGRPIQTVEYKGDSLYSAYYHFMVDMGYFNSTEDAKKRGRR